MTSAQVWRALARASFAVVSYVTPGGEPRSSGVVYASAGERLSSCRRRRQLESQAYLSGQVAVTVPARRGGLLSLLVPIPPATVSFHGRAIVTRPAPMDSAALPKPLTSLLPAERQALSRVVEIIPEGQFVTYGVGVSLMRMRDTSAARGASW